MKKYLFLIIAIFPLCISAQTLRGIVIDANTQQGVAGAHIQTENKNGTATNANGQFELPCAKQISIQHISYQSTSVSIEECDKQLRIILTPLVNKLNEVEITATSSATKNVLEQPESIVKLKEREIKRGQGIFMDDAINANVPGMYMSRRGVSSGQQFNIRGYGNGLGFKGASNNFDTRGTKVYLNGIPITDAEGLTTMDDIDFGSIGSVEVSKGPSGTLYGLAIAGVVNLSTVQPEAGRTSLGQNVMIGDYGVQRYTTTFQTGGENASLLLNYGRQMADGFMEHTASDKTFLNAIAEFSPNKKQHISTYFGYSNSYDERAGELTIAQYEAGDYTGNSRYIQNNAHSEIVSFRAGITHSYQFNSHISNTTTFYGSGAAMNSSSAGGWNDNHPINYGLRTSLDFSYKIGNHLNLTGIAGFEAQRQNAQPISYGMVTDSNNLDGYNIIGSMRSNQITNTANYSYFTEWTLGLPKGFALSAGLGISNMIIDLENHLYDASNTAPLSYHASYKNMVSPHFAVNKIFSKNYSVYASFSKGYRPPAASNIVISGTGELNTGLVPEEGTQIEIGTKGNTLAGKLHYELALYQARFKNKMTSTAVPLDSVTTAYTYVTNSGGQINNGVEVLLKYTAFESNTTFVSQVQPWANFTYSDFVYHDFYYESVPRGATQATAEHYDGNAVAGVSPVVFNLGVDITTRIGFYGNINFNYKDAQPITSDNQNMTEAFHLLNAKIGFQKFIGKHWDLNLFVGANNITSQQQYYMVFINQLSDAYIPGPSEINLYTGLNVKYVF